MLWDNLPAICVALKISFVRFPDVEDERIFRENMVIRDVDSHSFDELSSIIEKKMAFMEYAQFDFTIFHIEKNGDRIVVDHSYYNRLVNKWSKAEAQFCDDSFLESQQLFLDRHTSCIPIDFSVEVEVKKKKIAPTSSSDGAQCLVPLTVENLAKMKSIPSVPTDTQRNTDNSADKSTTKFTSIKDLSCPPPHLDFFVRGVVIAIRFKAGKSGVEVVEVDLCDPSDSSFEVTAMSFDATVRKAIKENLKSDRRQVVELHKIYVRKKNDVDIRFQSNRHPCLLRLDRYSRIEVIQILTIPLPAKVQDSIVTVRQNMPCGGPVELAALVAGNEIPSQQASSFLSGKSDASSHSSSTPYVGQRRTTFCLRTMPLRNNCSNVPPSTSLSDEKKRMESHLREPGVVHTSKRDVEAREEAVADYVAHEEHRKDCVRRKKEVSSQCILCGLDFQSEAICMSIVRRLLEANNRNRGSKIPSVDELKIALSDLRWGAQRGSSVPRVTSKATFVNLEKKTVHRVHCRCAHLCTSYQLGKSIEDIVSYELSFNTCVLCGFSGATVSCYHPDCSEQYHAICAIYSNGYVNFGKKDPYKPCPACPRHTQVSISINPKEQNVLHEDESCWEDNIAFDSRVVESTDLRDPDANGGM